MAEAKTDKLFKSISEISKNLNKESDSINTVLEAFEKRLNSLNLGLEVWLEDDPLEHTEREGDHRHITYHRAVLGYSRAFDMTGWGLTVKWVKREEWVERCDITEMKSPRSQDFKDDIGPRCLLKASRDLRVSALDKLLKLLEVLEMKARETVASIEKAKESLK